MPVICNEADSTRGLAMAYDQVIEGIVEKKYKPVYGKNFTLEDSGLSATSALEALPYNISPKNNTMLAQSDGINIPSWYLAGRGSFSPIHQEDGYLDSSNILHWGDSRSKYHKVWVFIHPHDTVRCVENLRVDVQKMWAKNDSLVYRVGRKGCDTPHFHKNLIVTIEWLERNKIKYEMLSQRPGDLVYVGPTILHQVVNFGINLAEAVNVGGSAWLKLGEIFMGCSCLNSNTKFIEPNRDAVTVVTQRHAPMLPCPELHCSYEAPNQGLLDTHRSITHKKSGELVCSHCVGRSAVYATAGSLAVHVSVYHTNKAVHKCVTCGHIFMSPRSLKRHQRDNHPVRVMK